MRYNKIILTPEQEAYLRDNYATVIHHTMCQVLGISKRTLIRFAKQRGLVKDMDALVEQKAARISESLKRKYLVEGFRGNPENGLVSRFKPGYSAVEFFGKERLMEMRRKSAESRKKRFAEERARVTFGLPQKTRLNVKKQPRKKIQDRCYLKMRGYIIDEANCIAYYTDQTRRATKLEAMPRRYFIFKPYEHQREQQDQQVAN